MTNQEELPDVLVVKRVLPHLANDPHITEILEGEAQVAIQISHPNIVKTYQSGDVNGRWYVAMEHLDGFPVGKCPLTSPLDALFVVSEVLFALDHLHGLEIGLPDDRLEIIHNNICPDNIYILFDGSVKLGKWRDVRRNQVSLEIQTEQREGSIAHSAPEHVLGLDHDHRSDIFSIGNTLAELIIHKKLFGRKNPLSTLLAMSEVRLEVLERNCYKIPDEIMPIIHCALAKKPQNRYSSASEMNKDIVQLLDLYDKDTLKRNLSLCVKNAQSKKSTVALEKAHKKDESKKKHEQGPCEISKEKSDDKIAIEEGGASHHETFEDVHTDSVALELDDSIKDDLDYFNSIGEYDLPISKKTPSVEADDSEIDFDNYMSSGDIEELLENAVLISEELEEQVEGPVEESSASDSSSSFVFYSSDLDDSLTSEENEIDDTYRRVFETATPTPQGPVGQITFLLKSGETLGPMSFAVALDQIATGEISSDEKVSLDGGEYQPITEIEALLGKKHQIFETEIKNNEVEAIQEDKENKFDSSIKPGDLCEETLVNLLLEIHDRQLDGMILFRHGPIKKEVYINNGKPVFARSNIASESFGEYLVHKGFLNRMELEMAYALMANFSNDIRRSLAGIGVIDDIKLESLATEHMKELIIDLFTWTKGDFILYDDRCVDEVLHVGGVNFLSLFWNGTLISVNKQEARVWWEQRKNYVVRSKMLKYIGVSDFGFPKVVEQILRKVQEPMLLEDAVSYKNRKEEDLIYYQVLGLRVCSQIGFVEIVEL